ncbi:MAG: hypothetical protein KAU62_07125 [Candidatus Heimdallarchaeota archaeon]|nr:hypothetical protein [Candidatus Heimdallarchaeota archaeon]MCG3255841.1 hypothetical protein [Candidatus Heimdallarchaeota archaeon]MCK4610913.1 hypothetical protein [Candidatus Heimdallarchaeota archaeon]
MVIIIPRTEGTETCARCILEGMVRFYLLAIFFSGPIIFAWGIGDLIFGEISVGESLGKVGGGLALTAFAVLFLFYQERKKRKTGEEYLDTLKLGFFSLVGLVEIIAGLAQAYDGAHGSARVMLVGGGALTLLPAGIWLLVKILKDTPTQTSDRKTSAPIAPPKEPPTQTYVETKTHNYTETTFPEPTETEIVEDESAEDFFSRLDKKSEYG